MAPKENKKEIIFEKNNSIRNNPGSFENFFESSPLLLRKIISKTENDLISISFYDHNYNAAFEENFFSFVPIYLD